MAWRYCLGALLAGCSVALAGCPDIDVPTPDNTAQDAAAQEDGVREWGEPSIRYVPLDAPTGVGQAVVVEGLPMVHTRQLLPLDAQGRLVGAGSADQQIEQVLSNLATVLDAAGSTLDRLVKLNVYADSPQTADRFFELLGQRLDPMVRPATSAVVSALAVPDALIAADAVATAAEQDTGVALQRCEDVAGDDGCADAAWAPRGGTVYLSGQPEKGPLARATAKSLATLLDVIGQLELQRSQVTQIKVFVEAATAAAEVLGEVKKCFPGQLTPPVIFVEWIASAPVEIEMILHLPLTGGKPVETVRYYTPHGVKASPTFSRVALAETDRQIYISGLVARAPGDGEAQVRDVFDQLTQILSETQSDLQHLAKATYYVSDDDASNMLNKLRPEFFDPERPPAASKATVPDVGHDDRTLMIDMIAVGNGR